MTWKWPCRIYEIYFNLLIINNLIFLFDCSFVWLFVTFWLNNWLIYWWVGWLVDWLIEWLIGWLIGWLDGWLVGVFVDWLVGWSINWLTDCFNQDADVILIAGWIWRILQGSNNTKNWPCSVQISHPKKTNCRPRTEFWRKCMCENRYQCCKQEDWVWENTAIRVPKMT